MSPSELETAILITLRRAGGRVGSDGMTVGDLQLGEDCHPIYALTSAGVHGAHAARIQQHQAANNKETDNAHH